MEVDPSLWDPWSIGHRFTNEMRGKLRIDAGDFYCPKSYSHIPLTKLCSLVMALLSYGIFSSSSQNFKDINGAYYKCLSHTHAWFKYQAQLSKVHVNTQVTGTTVHVHICIRIHSHIPLTKLCRLVI